MAEQLDDMDYPDPEEVVIAFLQHELDGDVAAASIDTQTPDTIRGPVLRVLRVGGTDDGLADKARMQVIAYDLTHHGARTLSRRIRKLMSGDYGHGGLNDAEVTLPDGTTVYVDGCRTDVAPERIPATNPRLQQDPAYYRVVLSAQ